MIADTDMDDATRADMQAYTGCIAGALTAQQFTDALEAAGLASVTITETHRVHASAASAIVRATKPAEVLPDANAGAACCSTGEQAKCCDLSEKSTCCSPQATAAGSCGCK